MSLFRYRPFALCSAGVMVFSALCFFFAPLRAPILLWCLGSVLLLSWGVLLGVRLGCKRPDFLKKRSKEVYRALCGAWLLLLAFFLSALTQTLWAAETVKAEEKAGKERTAVCTVLSDEGKTAYSSRYTVRLTEIDGEKVSVKAELTLSFFADFQTGDVLAWQGEIEENDPAWRTRNLADRLYLEAKVKKEENLVLRGRTETLETFFLNLNESASEALRGDVGGEEGEIACALLLGNRANLSERVERQFRRCGVSHLLALSGLHMAVLLGGIEFLLKKCRLALLPRRLAVCLLGTGYLALTGVSLSALRALLMLGAVYLSGLFATRRDGITALFGAVGGILLFLPSSVCDVSLWLSFGATFGILLFASPITVSVKAFCTPNPYRYYLLRVSHPKRYKRLVLCGKAAGWILSAFAVSLCAIGFVLGFSWLWFGEVSFLGAPMTLILSPLTEGLLFILLAWSLVLPFPFLSSLVGKVASLPATAMLKICEGGSSLRFPLISLSYDFAGWLIFGFTALMLVALLLPINPKRRLLWIPLAFVLCFTSCVVGTETVRRGDIRFCLDRSEEGDTAAICSDGYGLIFDRSGGDYGALKTAADALREASYCEIDLLVLTDYNGVLPTSIPSFLARETVRTLCLPKPETERESDWLQALAAALEGRETSLYLYADGEEIPIFAGAVLTVTRTGDSFLATLTRGAQVFCYADGAVQTLPENGGETLYAFGQTLLGEGNLPCPSGDGCLILMPASQRGSLFAPETLNENAVYAIWDGRNVAVFDKKGA